MTSGVVAPARDRYFVEPLPHRIDHMNGLPDIRAFLVASRRLMTTAGATTASFGHLAKSRCIGHLQL